MANKRLPFVPVDKHQEEALICQHTTSGCLSLSLSCSAGCAPYRNQITLRRLRSNCQKSSCTQTRSGAVRSQEAASKLQCSRKSRKRIASADMAAPPSQRPKRQPQQPSPRAPQVVVAAHVRHLIRLSCYKWTHKSLRRLRELRVGKVEPY